VFAYLKPFRALQAVLSHLQRRDVSTVVYIPGDAGRVARQKFGSDRLRFSLERINTQTICGACDLAILNGGHGTTAEMLLAGVPILELPLVLEQSLVARRVDAIGAGIEAPAEDPTAAITALDRLLEELPRFRAPAKQFAIRHADFSPSREVGEMVDRIEGLLAEGPT
jgi:UDP:flavonoid glycosyltransferase YjiC (YdhE family)